jgi:hypothetical protein
MLLNIMTPLQRTGLGLFVLGTLIDCMVWIVLMLDPNKLSGE